MKTKTQAQTQIQTQVQKVFNEGELTLNKDGSVDKRCKEYRKTKQMYLNELKHGAQIKDTHPQLSEKYIQHAKRGLKSLGVLV